MKLPCKIVEDLLPLFEENLCSTESKAAVQSHLEECADCREKISRTVIPEIDFHNAAECKTLRKGMRKIRKLWVLSLIAVLLTIPLLFLSANSIRGRGLGFGNLRELILVRNFAQALEDGRFADAAELLDHNLRYTSMKANLAEAESGWDSSYFSPISISGEQWMVQDYYKNEYLTESRESPWLHPILNDDPIFVPSDIIPALGDLYPDQFRAQDDGTYLVDDRIWRIGDTRWGKYWIRDGSVFDADCTAQELCCGLVFVPKEIFDQALPILQETAQKNFEDLLQHYGKAASLEKEEFSSAATAHYAKQLLDAHNKGLRFDARGPENCIRQDDGSWLISWSFVIHLNGESQPMSLCCRVRDAGITPVYLNWPGEPDSTNAAMVLFPKFPE